MERNDFSISKHIISLYVPNKTFIKCLEHHIAFYPIWSGRQWIFLWVYYHMNGANNLHFVHYVRIQGSGYCVSELLKYCLNIYSRSAPQSGSWQTHPLIQMWTVSHYVQHSLCFCWGKVLKNMNTADYLSWLSKFLIDLSPPSFLSITIPNFKVSIFNFYAWKNVSIYPPRPTKSSKYQWDAKPPTNFGDEGQNYFIWIVKTKTKY